MQIDEKADGVGSEDSAKLDGSKVFGDWWTISEASSLNDNEVGSLLHWTEAKSSVTTTATGPWLKCVIGRRLNYVHDDVQKRMYVNETVFLDRTLSVSTTCWAEALSESWTSTDDGNNLAIADGDDVKCSMTVWLACSGKHHQLCLTLCTMFWVTDSMASDYRWTFCGNWSLQTKVDKHRGILRRSRRFLWFNCVHRWPQNPCWWL